MRKPTSQFAAFVFAAMLMTAAGRTVSGADIVWVGPANGDYADPLNWNPNAVPSAGNDAIIGNGGIADLSTDVSGLGLNRLRVGQDSIGQLNVNGPDGHLLATDEAFIGWGGAGNGTIVNGGIVDIQHWVNIGRDGGQGNVQNNGQFIVGPTPGSGSQELRVGAWGGTANYSNGIGALTRVANELRVGIGQNGTGEANGTFDNFGDVQSRHISVGRDGGKGVFNQYAGTVSTVNEMWVGAGRGDDPLHGANGTLNVFDGTINSNGDFMVGFGGDNNVLPLGSNVRGVVNQTGGTVNSTGWMNVGRDGVTNKGVYNISGGTLNVTGVVTVIGQGAQGEFNHTGNADPFIASNVNNVEFWVGMGSAGGNGVANTPGTNVALNTQFNTQRLGVGRNGATGLMNQGDGGTIAVSNDIHIGENQGSKGTYNLGAFASLTAQGGSNIGVDGATLGQLNMAPGSVFVSGNENNIGSSGGTGVVNNDGGSYTTNGWMGVGRDNGNGTFNNKNGGSVHATQELRIGMWGGTGTFNNDATAGDVISDTELRVGMGANVWGQGKATFNANGGNIQGSGNISVGRDGGIGTFNQDNGATGNTVTAGEMLVGIGSGDGQLLGAQGTYNLKSGTLNVTAGGDAGRGRFAVGTDTFGYNASGATSKFNMTGGTLNMTSNGRTSIGWNGKGEVNQSSGTATLNDVWIGSHDGGLMTGEGAYNMSGDAVMNTPSLVMLGRGGTGGGKGSFSIADAAVANIGDRLSVGVEPGAFGQYDQTGGTMNIAHSLTVGEQRDAFRGPATGNYVQTGGVMNFGAGLGGNDESLNIGNGGSNGTATISGGTFQQPATAAWSGNGGWNFIGHNGGTGVFNVSGTADVRLLGRVHIGAGGFSQGTVNQTGGSFLQTGTGGGNEHEITLGDGDSTGTYNISGGTLHTEGSMYVGHWTNSHGFMNISEPSALNPTVVNVDRFFTVGRYADPGQGATQTTGVVTQSGGTVNTGELALASGRQTDGGVNGTTSLRGDYTLSGGTLNVAGLSYIGRHGEGHFTQTGGSFTSGDSIRLGSDNDPAVFGTYSISAGSLTSTAGAIEVGEGSPTLSTFTQTGGTVSAAGGIALGTGNGTKGDYSISAGTANVGLAAAVAYADNSIGNFTQTGGTVQGEGVAVGLGTDAVGSYKQSGGTVKVTGLTTAPAPANSGVIVGLGPGAIGSYELSGGTLDLDGHDLLLNPFGVATSGTFTMTGGTLAGVGTFSLAQGAVDATLTNQGGIVAPASTGGLTGVMNVIGNYDDDLTSTLQAQLGGTAAGAYDAMAITQFATLNGTLAVSLVNGFQPHTGDFFQVVTTGGGTFGTFSLITGKDLSGIGGAGYALNRITDGLNVGLLAALPGDANLDKIDDFTDLGLLLNNFNAPNAGGVGEWGAGDFNDDHVTDFTDLGILLNNFNVSVSLSASAAPLAGVPEPSTWALLAMGSLALVTLRMRRRA